MAGAWRPTVDPASAQTLGLLATTSLNPQDASPRRLGLQTCPLPRWHRGAAALIPSPNLERGQLSANLSTSRQCLGSACAIHNHPRAPVAQKRYHAPDTLTGWAPTALHFYGQAYPLGRGEVQRRATRPRPQVRCTFSVAGAWRPTVAPASPQTLGLLGPAVSSLNTPRRDGSACKLVPFPGGTAARPP